MISTYEIDTPDTETALEILRATLRGQLILPDDIKYEGARRLWNGIFDKRPALIVRCVETADVITAVNFAREHHLCVAVRGGGHSAAGHSMSEGGMTIDLSGMKSVSVDPVAQVAQAEPGLLLSDLDQATQAYGLAVPAGQISHTGVAGLTLGGGVGWLMRKYGLTVDNLLAVKIVTADGRLLTASEDINPDLFWGVRGGGGNFGIVTNFTFRLHPVGPEMLGGPVLYSLDKATNVLRKFRQFMANAPDELTAFAVLLTIPPSEPFPAYLHGKPMLVLDMCYAGPIAEGEKVVKPLRSLETPDLDLVGPLPYVVRQSMLDTSAPPGMHYYTTASYLQDLEDEAIETLVAHFAHVTNPLIHLTVSRLGGAIARVAEDATAFSHRHSTYLLWLIGVWPPEDEAELHVQWVRGLSAAMQPFKSGGVYVNALGEERQERVEAAYGAAKYRRLQALKQKYDPTNFFHLNQNITPANRPY